MTLSLDEGVVERKGCPLHYWTAGPEGRPLVVFTHGAYVDHHSFDPHLPVIAKDYRILAWDVRGHGKSRPMGDRFAVPLAVDDLLAVMDQLGYEKAVFVGHSAGAAITQELVFRCPERARALVLADCACITSRHDGFKAFFITRLAPSIMALIPFETLRRSMLKDFSQVAEVRDYTSRAFSQISKQDFLSIFRGSVNSMHYEPGYQISQPLLLTHGEFDTVPGVQEVPEWARREPNCQYRVIPKAGHFAILDNADFFNRLLLEFLANLQSD